MSLVMGSGRYGMERSSCRVDMRAWPQTPSTCPNSGHSRPKMSMGFPFALHPPVQLQECRPCRVHLPWEALHHALWTRRRAFLCCRDRDASQSPGRFCSKLSSTSVGFCDASLHNHRGCRAKTMVTPRRQRPEAHESRNSLERLSLTCLSASSAILPVRQLDIGDVLLVLLRGNLKTCDGPSLEGLTKHLRYINPPRKVWEVGDSLVT